MLAVKIWNYCTIIRLTKHWRLNIKPSSNNSLSSYLQQHRWSAATKKDGVPHLHGWYKKIQKRIVSFLFWFTVLQFVLNTVFLEQPTVISCPVIPHISLNPHFHMSQSHPPPGIWMLQQLLLKPPIQWLPEFLSLRQWVGIRSWPLTTI